MKPISIVTLSTICLLFNNLYAQKNLPFIKVEGAAEKTINLYEHDIASMKRSAVYLKEQNGIEYSYDGVSIQDILTHAGMKIDEQHNSDNLSKYVMIKGADGFEAVFSMAEIDSAFNNRTIILADKINGKPLPKGLGPFRLIVPGEENRVRWLWEVNSLIVAYAKE